MPSRPVSLPPRHALIIGASSGIGAALARRLASEGYHLALLARRADLLQSLCTEINTRADEILATPYTHDVTDTVAIPALLHQILHELGGLDLVIYCAGLSLPSGMKHYEFDKDIYITQVNYLGAVAWLNPVAALFHRLRAGTIVGISSVAGERGRVGSPAYYASKAALTSYLESLRNRLSRRGVHVLTVKPGYVQTDMLAQVKRPFLVISPERAAADISKAIRRHKQELYTPPIWWLIMLVIRNIPSFIFRRLNI